MKFKHPNKIIIGDIEFDLIYDKTNSEAEFNYPKKDKRGYIKLGIETQKVNPLRFLNLLIHEFKEIIQNEQNTRYDRLDEHSDNSYEFHYSHKEHTDLCARLSGVLSNFIN